MKRLLVVTIGFAFLVLASSGALALPPDAPGDVSGYVPGEVLVKFKSGTPQGVADEQIARNGARTVDRILALDVLVLGVPKNQELRIVSALSKNPNVEYAEPNYLGSAASVPDDPHFGPYQ